MLGAPLDVYCARGHGRSYGEWSRVLGRSLPGILGCDLWSALERERSCETFGVLADIGNDLVYGAPVATLRGWVEQCLERLQWHQARSVLVLPPRERLERLRPWEYRVARALLFPGRSLAFGEALARVRALEGELRSLCRQCGVAVVAPLRGWYGVDPIHLRRQVAGAAWLEVLGTLFRQDGAGGELRPQRCASLPLARRCQLRMGRPSEWRLFGLRLRSTQPWARLKDGSRVSLY